MSGSVDRPLSPHLQVYRPQLTSVLSITHRATGIFLSLGSVFLAAWLISAAVGEEAFNCMNDMVGAWYGQLLLLGWTYALFFHLCNGIRHLVWDAGVGLEIKTAYVTGYVVVAVSMLLTLAVWACALL